LDRGGKLALSHRRDVDIDAKIDAIVDDFANAQIRDEIAASKKKGLWMGGVVPWLLGREPYASQAQKARATIALATARTCAGSARDHCIVFR
jgi:hypothetical protein